jgi:hypothetical protein
MATLPGLPMFGHGQIEGFTERYGMEYRRAYYEERPDQWLVARHEREISPLLHRRGLFAEVREFLLYDFFTDDGWVNEDVYAYSNKLGDDRALVVYHNRYASTRGWIRMSVGYAEKTGGGKHIRQRSLAEGLGFSGDGNALVGYRDCFSGLEFLQRGRDLAEKGLRVELNAYECHVLLDWREWRDDGTRPWGELCNMLAGHGVSSVEDALRELELKPVHEAVRELLDPALLEGLAELAAGVVHPNPGREVLEKLEERTIALLQRARRYAMSAGAKAAGIEVPDWDGEEYDAVRGFRERLEAALRLPGLEAQFSTAWSREACAVLPCATATESIERTIWAPVVAWCALEALARSQDPEDPEAAATALFDKLRLRQPIADAFAAAGMEGDERWRAAARLRAAFAHAAWAPGAEPVSIRSAALFSWLHDPDVAWLIGAHEYQGQRYFVKEPYERLLWWMALRALLDIAGQEHPSEERIRIVEHEVEARMNAAERAGYQVDALFEQGRGSY